MLIVVIRSLHLVVQYAIHNIRQKTETKIGNAFVHSKLNCLPITFYFICATHNYTEIDCQNIKTNTLEL